MRELLLHNRNFASLWLGQMISGTATTLFDVGVMVAIYQATGSALQTAAVTVAATLPNFLLGSVAGANDLSISLWQTIKDGAAYLRQHQLARALVTMEGLEHIGHGIWMPALLLIFVERALGGSARDWGWQMGLYYAGQIFGVVLIMMATNMLARRPGWIIISNAFTTGLLTLIYAASPTLLFAHILCFVFGVPYAWRDVAQDSLLQTSVDSAVLGRIYAFRGMFLNLMLMLSTLLFAWLADQLPIRWIYAIGGIVYLGTAVYALSRPAMRRSRIGAEGKGRPGDQEIPQSASANSQLGRKA